MSSGFGLCVLICVLAVEVSCSYEGALLCPVSAFGSKYGLQMGIRTFAGGLYHASNEVAFFAAPVLSELYRW